MSFDVELEKDILSQCLRSKAYLSKAVALVEAHVFSSRSFAWVWGVLEETYRVHRELPSPAFLLAKIDTDYGETEDAAHMETVLEALYDRETSSPKAALAEIRRFIKMAAARAVADTALDSIDSGDVEAAEAAVEKGVASMRRASVLVEPTPWGSTAVERLDRYVARATPGARPVFKTMSDTLDMRALRGGFPAGKIGEIQANTNVGKTTFIVDLGYNALTRSGAVVLHITSEDEIEEVELRYDARLTGIGRNALESGKLTRLQRETYKEAFERHPHLHDSLFCCYLPKGHKVTMVTPLVEMVRERHPTRPILFIYDSPFHAKGPDRFYKEKRHEVRDVVEYLDNIAKDKSLGFGDVGIWFTHQANRASAGKVPTAESGAESYDVERTVDFGIGLREGVDLAGSKEKTIEGWVIRNRINRMKKAVVYFKADLDLCRFREVAAFEIEEEEGEG